MFTDSGICWVLCSVSAFTFRWFPLQGAEDHWLSGYATKNHQISFETWPPRLENGGYALFLTPLSLKKLISSISEHGFIVNDT